MTEQKRTYTMLSGDTEKLFTWQTAALSGVGLAINLLLANLVKWMNLPLYIDNVGSLLVGALAGPIPGMTVGFLSNAINAFGDAITMYYGILTIVMAMLASWYTQKGLFRSVRGCTLAVGSFVVIGGGVGSVMTWLLYGGGIGGIGAPLALQLNGMGISAFFSQLLADIVIDIPDKTITVTLVVLLLNICTRLFPGCFPLSSYYEASAGAAEETKSVLPAEKPHSIKELILRLIILCSVLISVSTIWISFSMYCGLTADMDERLTYLIRLISVSFAVTILISVMTIWFAARRIAEPVNRIVRQSREFLAMPSQDWLASDSWKNRTPVETGDEIEELYQAICAEQETVARNVAMMKQTEEQLRHSHELEDALENARQASEAKGQFLSRMSHEIRTPLNAVIGYLDIAQASADQPEKIMHCVQNSQLAARHLLNIINDVLDISSIESGKMKIAREEFDLREQLITVSTLFYNQAKAKRVSFRTSVQDLTQEWFVGDSLRLNQVLMNLLSNAVKFTPAGGTVSLTVAQARSTDSTVYLKFIVQDTGIGMSEEFRRRLFKPFEQESATTAQKYGGTGLGLSITGNLVSMMKGAIDVNSVQGEGSCFTVTLPFGCGTQHTAAADVSCRRRALIVADDRQGAELKKLLKTCGVRADTASDGPAAVRQLILRESGDYPYDLCLIDWNLPEAGGSRTVEAMRAACSGKPPLFVAAGYDITEIEDEAKAAGAEVLLPKPLFRSTIRNLLAENCGGRTAQPQQAQPQQLAGIHILLAEDNAMNREIAVDILQKAGILVDTAEDGRQAVEKFAAAPETYQAILMDIQMPVMDGYAATRAIRALPVARAKKVPIIAMTANAFHEDVAAALSAGMDDHIAKPVDYEKLFQALRKFS